MYFRYSANVVAPIQCNCPLASIGLRRLAASIPPSPLDPAPIRRWISSTKRTIISFESSISLSTPFMRSSNSPRYLLPATREPTSRDSSLQAARLAGTSALMMRDAKPSTTVVFPTPGSPIRTGLFFVRRDRMRTTRRISSSRPITGSIFPSRAKAVISIVNFFRFSFSSSASAVFESTLFVPRICCIAESMSFVLGIFASAKHRCIEESCAKAVIK